MKSLFIIVFAICIFRLYESFSLSNSLLASNINSLVDDSGNFTDSNSLPFEYSQPEFQEANIDRQPTPKVTVPIVRSFFQRIFGLHDNVVERFLGLVIDDPDALRVAVKILSTVIWAFIILSALGTVGFDTKPFLSLISVLGLTVGLSIKEILTNTFAGLLIILTSPFKRGWIISIGGFKGKVLSIDTRYVKLQNPRDKTEILVPLSLVYSSAIIIEQKGE